LSIAMQAFDPGQKCEWISSAETPNGKSLKNGHRHTIGDSLQTTMFGNQKATDLEAAQRELSPASRCAA